MNVTNPSSVIFILYDVGCSSCFINFILSFVELTVCEMSVKTLIEKDKKPAEKTFKETVGKEKEAVKITDFPPPARMQESVAPMSKVPLLPLPTDPRLSAMDNARRSDEVPIRSFYKPPASERLPSGPDPGRISIRNSLRETLLNRYSLDCLVLIGFYNIQIIR